MRLKTIEIYQFHELEDYAKERARDYFRNSSDLWGWQSEWWESAQAFSKIAPIDIREADFERRHVDIRWTGDDDLAELSGLRAWKWLENNNWFKWAADNKSGKCTMTGYCGDCPFGDAIAEYKDDPKHTPELKQVFYEAAQAWIHEAAADMEYCYSDEHIDDLIEINEYEFLDNGTFA